MNTTDKQTVTDAGTLPREVDPKTWEVLVLLNGSLAALSQNKQFPADIKAAKNWIRDAIALVNGEATIQPGTGGMLVKAGSIL